MKHYHRVVMLVALLALLVPSMAPASSSLMSAAAPSHVYAQSRAERSSPSSLLAASSLNTSLAHSTGSPMSPELTQDDTTFTIERIEINQVLGYQFNNSLTFVAGKQTAIRAFLSQEVEVSTDTDSTYAVIKRDGKDVTTLAAKSYDKPTNVVDFLCPSMNQCGSWAAGNYAFDVAVNGVTKNTEGTSYVFENRRELRVLAVAITERLGDRVIPMPNDAWKKTWPFTQRVYPLAEGNLKWTVREQPLDLSDVTYDLTDDKKQCDVWQALRNLIPDNCDANPNQEGCVDEVVGYIWENPPGTAGFTCGAGATIVVAGDQDVQATVAHEIAHNYGVGDTYQGGSLACSVNPAPDGFGCSAGRQANGNAALIPASHHPYEIGGRGALGDMKCYMGSGGQQHEFWTTQDTYHHLFGKFAPKAAASLQQATPQRLIAVEGFVTKNGQVDLDPWYTFTDTLTLEDTAPMTPTSDIVFMVEGLDASGQQVVTKTLDVSFNALNNPPTVLKWAPFEEVLPFPNAVTRFNIISSTLAVSDVLKTIVVSPNAPVVTAVTPIASGMTLTGPYTITWAGNDADSSNRIYQGIVPYYTVEYNPDVTNDESDWYVLASNLTTTTWSDDFATLPGGKHAKIRVTMSDGILTGEAESAEFVVPAKAPEVFIEPPEWGYDYEEGDEVILEADAYDLQDGWLDDDRLVWTSNLSGTLGNGTDVIVDNLPIGDHTITVTATNRAGLAASSSITLSIGTVSYEYIPYPAPFNETVINNFERKNTSTKGHVRTMVNVPTSAIYTDTFVTYWHERQPASATPPAGYHFAGRSFSLSFDVADGNNWKEVTTLAAGSGVTVSLEYQPILPNNTTPMSLTLFRWNDTTKTWVDAASECSPASTYNRDYMDMVEVRVCRAGTYTLAGKTTGWRRVFSESFDSFPNARWQVASTGSDPNITWGSTSYEYDIFGTSSMHSAWPAAGGAKRVDISETENYPPNLGSWMIAGPFDLTQLKAAELYYSQLSDMEENDWAGVCVTAESTNPVADFATPDANCSWWSDDTGTWDVAHMDLEAYAGKANVYIGWAFLSDASNTSNRLGLFVDEIELWGADVPSATLDDFANWDTLYYEPFDQVDLATNSSWKHVTNQSGVQWSTTATKNDSYTNPNSTKAATAVAPGSGYPAGVQSWMIYGPLDLQTKAYADVSFSVNYDLVFADANNPSKNDWLGFCVGTSADPATFDYEGCTWWTGSTEDDWEDAYDDISAYAGKKNVYLGWVLLSNVGSTTKAGAFVDELSIWAQDATEDEKPLSFDADGLLLKNGAFDQNLTNWTVKGSVTTVPLGGNPAASLTGSANLYQAFTVPARSNDVMVSFAYAFTSTETVAGKDMACASLTPQTNPTPIHVSDILVDFGCWDVTEMPEFAMQDQQFDDVTFNLTEQEMAKVKGRPIALNIELTQDTAVSGTTTLYIDDVVVYTTGASRRNAGQNDGKGAQRDPNEPNDSRSSATDVSCGQTIDATFGDVGGGADDDYYTLVRLPKGKVGIDIDADTLRPSSKVDSHLVLYDAQGTKIAENDDDGVTVDSLLVYDNPTENATLVVHAFSWTEPERGNKTSYKLKVTCGSAVPPAPGSSIRTTPMSLTLNSNQPAVAPAPVAIPEQPRVQANKKAWTAILYLNGEDQGCVQNQNPEACWDKNYELSITGIEAFIAQKQDFLNVVVLLDGPNYGGVASDVRRYVVQPNGQYTEGVNKWNLPEANLGDPQVFADFVTWAMVNYPAEHYFVSIDDHGDGIRGVGWDHTGPDGAKIDDQITPAELRSALKKSTKQGQRKIDIFDYEACLMGMVENAYDLKEYVSYVAFFQPISWTSVNYPEYLRDLQQTDDAQTVGKRVIQKYPISQQPYSFALIDLSKIKDVRQKLDAFADALRNAGKNDTLAQIRDTVQAFNGEPDKGNAASNGTYLDIVDLADKVAVQGIAPAEAAALRTAVTASVVDSKAVKKGLDNNVVWDYSNYHGLSVYYPQKQTMELDDYQKSYQVIGDGTWDEFLTYYFTGKQPTRPSNVPDVLEEKPDPAVSPLQVVNLVYLPMVERAEARPTR